MGVAIVTTVYLLFPAMTANAAPVFIKKGHPIDCGKRLRDKRRLFGDGKSFEGFALGVAVGVATTLIELVGVPGSQRFVTGLTFSIGALLGDLCGAFVKRRAGFERGQPAPLLDQLDFVLGAYLLAIVVNYGIGEGASVFGNGIPVGEQLTIVLTSLYIIPIIHLLTNAGAYKLKLKTNPW